MTSLLFLRSIASPRLALCAVFALLAGCESGSYLTGTPFYEDEEDRQVLVKDQNDHPVPDCMVVGTERNFAFYGQDRQVIVMTDMRGIAKMRLKGEVRIVAGRQPFYPGELTFNTSAAVVNVASDHITEGGFVDFTEYKLPIDLVRVKSPYWIDWIDYIHWLEKKGYKVSQDESLESFDEKTRAEIRKAEDL